MNKIIQSLGTVIVVIEGIQIAIEAFGHRNVVTRSVRELAEGMGYDKRRREILRKLLGVTGWHHLRPGDKHLYSLSRNPPGTGYPHDAKAIAAAAKVFNDQAETAETDVIKDQLLAHDSIVCAGSPVSNPWTGAHLPVRQERDSKSTRSSHRIEGKRDRPRYKVRPESLRYHFAFGAAKTVRVISAMIEGEEQPKATHGIWDNQGKELWRPADYIDQARWLQRDFLLVSRLPRTPTGGSVLTIAGGHGAGTQAFELLLDPSAFPYDQIEELQRQLQGKKYYQIVFEAYDIEHSPKYAAARHRPPSVAWKLAISKDLPVVEIDPKRLLVEL